LLTNDCNASDGVAGRYRERGVHYVAERVADPARPDGDERVQLGEIWVTPDTRRTTGGR
jgi:O-acetyl-ADP-ribose deacetylase (regulator of RNase III)